MWPSSLPSPLCRLIQDYTNTQNPVTKSVLRDIIAKRLGLDSGSAIYETTPDELDRLVKEAKLKEVPPRILCIDKVLIT